MNRPLLPTEDKLRPYIERIDKNRYYTNFSELNSEYQERLAGMFGAPVVTGSSATSLLTATLMAYDLPKGSLVAMPSYTFPATAAAAVSAGLVPYFHDVAHENGWGEKNVISIDDTSKVAAMIVVAPFGCSLNLAIRDDFSEQRKIPIIIDAAAGFDNFSTVCKPMRCPVVISTHSTKSFGTGEGGFVTCRDKPLLERIRRITNFGLSPSRCIEYTGLNAKFSEYHAAVGLAELDAWPEKRLKLLEAVKPYGLNYAVTQVPVRGAGKMGVYGCHRHKAYADYPRTEMPVTNELIENVGAVMIGID